MRFSTVTIVAFIAYTSNQVIAAPIHTYSPAIEGQDHKHHNNSHSRHNSHDLAKQAHDYAHIEENDELAEQNKDLEDAEFDHPRDPGRHDRNHPYQAHDSEPLDAPHIQKIQARSPYKTWRCQKRDLQDIEARARPGVVCANNRIMKLVNIIPS